MRMLVTRNMAGAILQNGGDFLLMKRSENRAFLPGYWGGVGGNIEPDEINAPRATCLREILEETGLCERDIENLQLKYIVLRRSKDEIRIQYFYFGVSNKRAVADTNEGSLHWVNKNELLNRKMTFTTKETLTHYLKIGHGQSSVTVGAADGAGGSPAISWCPRNDWER